MQTFSARVVALGLSAIIVGISFCIASCSRNGSQEPPGDTPEGISVVGHGEASPDTPATDATIDAKFLSNVARRMMADVDRRDRLEVIGVTRLPNAGHLPQAIVEVEVTAHNSVQEGAIVVFVQTTALDMRCHAHFAITRHPMEGEVVMLVFDAEGSRLVRRDVVSAQSAQGFLAESRSDNTAAVAALAKEIDQFTPLRPWVEDSTSALGTVPVMRDNELRVGDKWTYDITTSKWLVFDSIARTDTVGEVSSNDTWSAARIRSEEVSGDASNGSEKADTAVPKVNTFWDARLDGEVFRLRDKGYSALKLEGLVESWRSDPAAHPELLVERVVRFPLVQGDQWENVQDGSEWELIAVEPTEISGRGELSDCAVLQSRWNTGGRLRWYCPDVGIVREETCSLTTSSDTLMVLDSYTRQ